MADDKWIQKAHIKKGALTEKAKAAGKSITEYCAQGGLDDHSKKQCSLAATFRKMAK